MALRILILGSNGQVGWELQRALASIGEVTAHDRSRCDLTRPNVLREAVASIKPQVIVNASAYTAVDRAESDSANAYALNATAVGMVAELALENRALLVHYSTNYVFDGSKTSAYLEADAPNPLSIYGASKLRGEQAILQSECDHLIFRVGWVFSCRGGNFIKTILHTAAEQHSLRVITDQHGTPTSAELIADVTAYAIRDVLARRATGGLYHLAADGETSWHEYANFILEQAQMLGARLVVSSAHPISTADYPTAAARPLNGCLDTSKLRKAFNLVLPDWRIAVCRTLAELLGSNP